MSNIVQSTGIQQVDATLRVLADPELTPEDRAAAYAVIHQIQLRLNHALRAVKDDLIIYMDANGVHDLGPLSVKATAIDSPGRATTRATGPMPACRSSSSSTPSSRPSTSATSPTTTRCPTAELGAGVHAADGGTAAPLELEAKGYRTEMGYAAQSVKEPIVGEERGSRAREVDSIIDPGAMFELAARAAGRRTRRRCGLRFVRETSVVEVLYSGSW